MRKSDQIEPDHGVITVTVVQHARTSPTPTPGSQSIHKGRFHGVYLFARVNRRQRHP